MKKILTKNWKQLFTCLFICSLFFWHFILSPLLPLLVSLLFHYYFVIILLLICYYWSLVKNWSDLWNRVCLFIRPSVTALLKKRSKDFSETWYEVRLENSVTLFLYILLILLKSSFFVFFLTL